MDEQQEATSFSFFTWAWEPVAKVVFVADAKVAMLIVGAVCFIMALVTACGNFTNILRVTFPQNSFCRIRANLKCKYNKAAPINMVWKAAFKMLVIFTPE